MALEHLKKVTTIDGFEVVHMDELREKHPELFPPEMKGQMDYEAFERDIRPNKFVYIRGDKNSITFNIQNGPIKEVGKNGCQIDTMIRATQYLLDRLNEKFYCVENDSASWHLEKAYQLMKERQRRRLEQGTEGTNSEKRVR